MDNIYDIDDNDKLYRRIKNINDCIEYCYDEHGNLVVCEEAFRDASFSPSIYISKLLNDKPDKVVKKDIQGVISFKAKDIRQILNVTTHLSDEDHTINHVIHVKHKPSKYSQHDSVNEKCRAKAHAIIYAQPNFTGNKGEKRRAFMKLKAALADIFNSIKPGWEHKPKKDSNVMCNDLKT